MRLIAAASIAALAAAGAAMAQDVGDGPESFFITSTGSGQGADLGGLEGADAHCADLASAAGLEARGWRAYLSTGDVDARDRIGAGPWYNVNGELVAEGLDDLHGEAAHFTKETALNEKGEVVNGRGDDPNQHDILTGSTLEGRLATGDDGAPLTCDGWTSSAETGSAMVGHFDRTGGGPNPTSWVAAHPSRGCSQANLEGTGGAGYFYCFASGE